MIGRVLAILLLVAGCAAAPPSGPGPVGIAAGPWREQLHWVPLRDAADQPHLLLARVCRPSGSGRAPVVIINHGTPPRAEDRARREPLSCDSDAAQWFLRRGFLVFAGLRRGHGRSSPVHAEAAPLCSEAQFVASAREAARDIDAFVAYAAALPGARPDRMVMIGQSTGGWSTIGYNSVPHPRVVAMVNVAGGRGGHYRLVPHSNCRPDQLIRAAGVLGRTATTPMLWLYTENDSYFGPSLARGLYDAFTRAGGRATLIQLAAFASDGHTLFYDRNGSAIWGPLVSAYLAERAPDLAGPH